MGFSGRKLIRRQVVDHLRGKAILGWVGGLAKPLVVEKDRKRKINAEQELIAYKKKNKLGGWGCRENQLGLALKPHRAKPRKMLQQGNNCVIVNSGKKERCCSGRGGSS